MSPDNCQFVLDAFARELYNKLFYYIVTKCNVTIMPAEVSQNKEKYRKIGMLDIFGFENFPTNSLEQFCINFTNEKLQHIYILHIFKNEKSIFAGEGLSNYISVIRYTDNSDIVELMDSKNNPRGIFDCIDSAVMANQGDSALIMNIIKLHRNHTKIVIGEKMATNSFKIKHTARTVTYTIDGFVEKDRDELPAAVVDLIYRTKDNLARLWQGKVGDAQTEHSYGNMKKIMKMNYLGYKFRMEMSELMEELEGNECNFVRCIKPNERKLAKQWNPS